MAENRPPRSADRWRAIFVAVQAREEALARSQAAIAVRSGEFAVALIAGITAVGRIALPFVAVNLAAAAPAAQASAQATRAAAKQRAVGQQAVLAASAAGTAAFARAGAAFIAAAIPGDGITAAHKFGKRKQQVGPPQGSQGAN